MSQIIDQQGALKDNTGQSDTEPCDCERKTCAIGIASIAIGIGGFIVATALL